MGQFNTIRLMRSGSRVPRRVPSMLPTITAPAFTIVLIGKPDPLNPYPSGRVPVYFTSQSDVSVYFMEEKIGSRI